MGAVGQRMHASDAAYGYTALDRPEGWHALKHAKCATCRSVTRHAYINDGPDDFAGEDWAEQIHHSGISRRLG
jgi:hypothetical protein